MVFARPDDYFLGSLHSRAHEVWCRAQGTQLRERESGLNYNVQSSFETFPFPTPRRREQAAVSTAARRLDELRDGWLNPPEWIQTEILEFTGSLDGPWARYVSEVDRRGIGTVRWPRIVPKDAECAESLKNRTLTNLYNQRPAWLQLAHEKLDAAVFAAYGWDAATSDDEVLAKLLELNLTRAAIEGQGCRIARRCPIDASSVRFPWHGGRGGRDSVLRNYSQSPQERPLSPLRAQKRRISLSYARD